MQRTVKYRGFEIHIDLLSTSKEMFDVWFRIEGPIKLSGVAALGERIKIRGGPFSPSLGLPRCGNRWPGCHRSHPWPCGLGANPDHPASGSHGEFSLTHGTRRTTGRCTFNPNRRCRGLLFFHLPTGSWSHVLG